MKVKLKKCITDKYLYDYGIINTRDDYNKIRTGNFKIVGRDNTDYFIRLRKPTNHWCVLKKWFITVKE